MLAETAGYISYGVTLPEAQLSRIPPVAPEKQAPQIGRLAAENREQFRVRAWAVVKGHGSARPGSVDDFPLLLGLGAKVLESSPHRHSFDSLHP